LTKHNLIHKRQYSFRENHPTELAITTIYDELLKNFDNKFITCSLFLDLTALTKEFDCFDQGRTQGVGGFGVKPPLELDILQKLISFARRLIVFAYFLLINWLKK